MRRDAVPFGLLRHSSRLVGVFLKPLRVLFELLGSLLGGSWEPLGASWGDLGPSWGEIGVVLGHFWSTLIFINFLESFWEQKGCRKGGILGGKMEPKSIQNRGANLRAKLSPLGVVLVRF